MILDDVEKVETTIYIVILGNNPTDRLPWILADTTDGCLTHYGLWDRTIASKESYIHTKYVLT